MKINLKNGVLNGPINFGIVTLVSMMVLIFVIWVFSPNQFSSDVTPVAKPFESGDIVYLKLDTTKLVITYELGMFDNKNYAYRATYKDGDKIVGKFVLSSELFKNE